MSADAIDTELALASPDALQMLQGLVTHRQPNLPCTDDPALFDERYREGDRHFQDRVAKAVAECRRCSVLAKCGLQQRIRAMTATQLDQAYGVIGGRYRPRPPRTPGRADRNGSFDYEALPAIDCTSEQLELIRQAEDLADARRSSGRRKVCA